MANHKFKRMRGFVYMVMAKCENCGLERKGTKGNYTYLTKTFNNNSGRTFSKHTDVEPPCRNFTPS